MELKKAPGKTMDQEQFDIVRIQMERIIKHIKSTLTEKQKEAIRNGTGYIHVNHWWSSPEKLELEVEYRDKV